MTTYMEKSRRKNGTAVKRPNLFMRIIKSVIPWKGDSIGTIIRKLIFIIALIVFLCTAIPLLTDVYSMYRDEWRNTSIQNIYTPDGETPAIIDDNGVRLPLPSFKELLEINPDTVGYIRINDTMIDYPVVKSKDNDYYLDHDFWKEQSRSGCIMMDYRCEVTPTGDSDNLVLYGHNMAVGTFFASLSEYWRTMHDTLDPSQVSMRMYKEHPVIDFNTIYEEGQWKIFAIDLFNVDEYYGEVYNYTNQLNFSTRDEFNRFAIEVMNRSDVFTDVDLRFGDQILTLSTCYWPYSEHMSNVRLVIFARKVRPGESSKVDVSKAKLNLYALRWEDAYYVRLGQNPDWTINSLKEHYWDTSMLEGYSESQNELYNGELKYRPATDFR